MSINNFNNDVKVCTIKDVRQDLFTYLARSPFVDADVFPDIYSGGGVYKKDFGSAAKEGCPFGVPQSLVKVPKNKQKRQDYAQLFQLLGMVDADKKLPDKIIAKSYKKLLDRQPLISGYDENGAQYFFLGNARGTLKYALQQRERVRRLSQLLMDNFEYLYFLTLTYSYKKYGRGRRHAWRLFSKQCSKTLHKLRNKYGCEYVAVLESTAKGYPHAHIMIGSPKPFHKEDTKIAKDGELFDCAGKRYLQKIVPSPIFKLQLARGDKIQHYLCKYLSKDLPDAAEFTAYTAGKISTEHRKALLSYLLPTYAGVRQLRCSKTIGKLAQRDSDSAGDSAGDSIITEGIDIDKRLADFDAWARADPFSREMRAPFLADDMQLTRSQADYYASALIWLCIKSSLCPCRMLKIISRRSDYDWCMNGTAVPMPGDEKAVELFKQKGRVIGCPGCPLSDAIENRREDFINWIIHNPFNPRVDMPKYMYPQEKKSDIEEYYLMKFVKKTANFNELFNVYPKTDKYDVNYAIPLDINDYLDLQRDSFIHKQWIVPVSFLSILRKEKYFPVFPAAAEYAGKESYAPMPVWCVITDPDGLFANQPDNANHQMISVYLTFSKKMAERCVKLYDLAIDEGFFGEK